MRATVYTNVKLLITVEGSWNDSCTIKQVREQATEDATRDLRRSLESVKNVQLVGSARSSKVELHFEGGK